MAVEFNKYANNYNLLIGKEASKKAETTIKEETKDCEKQVSNFKGLKNETDLLTQNLKKGQVNDDQRMKDILNVLIDLLM